MANQKMRHQPRSFAEANAVLGGQGIVILGDHTALVKHAEYVSICYWNTEIVKFWNDGRITLHTGGFRTVSTKSRINQFVKGHLYQQNGSWMYVNSTEEYAGEIRPFFEGIDVA